MIKKINEKLSYRLEKHFGLTQYQVYSQSGGKLCQENTCKDSPIQIIKPTYDELMDLCQTSSMDITENFITKAIAKKDVCYLASKDKQPVGYTWLSRNDTLIDQNILHRASGYYLYKCYVHPLCRGQRVASLLTQHILQEIQPHEYLYCFVASANSASQKAFVHAGLTKSGRVTFFHHKNRFRYWTSGDSFSRQLEFLLNSEN